MYLQLFSATSKHFDPRFYILYEFKIVKDRVIVPGGRVDSQKTHSRYISGIGSMSSFFQRA